MPRLPFPRKLAALAAVTAVLALAPPPGAAAAPGRGLDPGLFGRLHGWLAALWTGAGCIIDPNGHCASGAVSPAGPRSARSPEGCVIDPSGRCGPAAAAPVLPRSVGAREGCILDPNGRCHAGVATRPASGRESRRPPA